MKKTTTVTRTRRVNGSQAGDNATQEKELLTALRAFKRGDFTARLPHDWTGVSGKIADTFNDVIGTNERLAKELERIARAVGKEGRITQRVTIGDVSEGWAEAIGSINNLIGDLVHPTSEMARVIGAVAKGDLSQTIANDIEGRPLRGEFQRTARIVNTMVEQLAAFASEVTRVAREVGTQGILGGQARVKGVAGTWKDLTENVNLMAGNLTAQVRNIAKVTTAVANGDLTKKITVDVKGEFLELKSARRGRLGNVERPNGLGQFHGAKSHRAGAQHRRRHHRGRQWRSLQENHRRRARRNPRTEGHHQHNG